jgi:hypothetical protein
VEIVNGFVCNTCTDVENAKKFIDPARPEAGPINQPPPELQRGPAVLLGGSLTGDQSQSQSQAERDAAIFQPYGPNGRR